MTQTLLLCQNSARQAQYLETSHAGTLCYAWWNHRTPCVRDDSMQRAHNTDGCRTELAQGSAPTHQRHEFRQVAAAQHALHAGLRRHMCRVPVQRALHIAGASSCLHRATPIWVGHKALRQTCVGSMRCETANAVA